MKWKIKLTLGVLIWCLSDSCGALSRPGSENPVKLTWPQQLNRSKMNFDTAARHFFPYLIENAAEIDLSTECTTSLLKTYKGFRDLKGWAVRLIDANGKFPEGLFEGRFSSLGSFDECLEVVADIATKGRLYTGQYCTVYLASSQDLVDSFYNSTEGTEQIESIMLRPKVMSRLLKRIPRYNRRFRLGVCAPSTCNRKDIKNLVNHAAKSINAIADVTRCEISRQEDVLVVSPLQAIIIVTVLSLIFLVMAASVYDGLLKNEAAENGGVEPPKALWQECVLAFSFPRNVSLLCAPTELSTTEGIKAITMAWLICGHTYFLFDNTYNFTGLLRGYDSIIRDVLFAPFANYTLAVTTLIFMSGLYLCVTIWKRLESKTFFPSVYLAENYAGWTALILINISILCLLPIFNDGPFWSEIVGSAIDNCATSWWRDILFISNFWPAETMCLHVTWYTATVAQFALIGIVITYLFYNAPGSAYGLSLCLFVIGILGTGIITYLKDLPPGVLFEPNFSEVIRVFSWIYHKPYAHISSYIVGIWLGYLLMTHHKVQLSMMGIILGWVSFLVSTNVLFSLSLTWSLDKPSVLSTVLYAGFHRPIWAFAVGWAVYALTQRSDQASCMAGSLISTFLSCVPLRIVGGLTNALFLVHPVLITAQRGQLRHIMHFSHFDQMNTFLGHYFFSLFVAFLLHICIERPFRHIGMVLAVAFKPDLYTKQLKRGATQIADMALAVKRATLIRTSSTANTTATVHPQPSHPPPPSVTVQGAYV